MQDEAQRIDAREEKFLANDHSDDAWVIDQLRRGGKYPRAAPLLFRAAATWPAFQFLLHHGVDLIQRADDGSTLLMDNLDVIDVDAYGRLAALFSAAGAIDLADDDSITPLCSMVRLGRLEKARILLKYGASPNSIARIRRYDGSPLDIATQAVLCNPLEGHRESISIAALELLKQYGLHVNKQSKERLQSRIPKEYKQLRDWFERNI